MEKTKERKKFDSLDIEKGVEWAQGRKLEQIGQRHKGGDEESGH